MKIQEIKNLIKSARGLVYIEFIKKDGTLRKMVINPKKKSTSTKKPTTWKIDKYLNTWSMNDSGYRNINVETITLIKFDKKSFVFETTKEMTGWDKIKEILKTETKLLKSSEVETDKVIEFFRNNIDLMIQKYPDTIIEANRFVEYSQVNKKMKLRFV